MHLCLDIGNTHIYGGIFKDERLAYQFRYPSKGGCSSDELGIFLKSYLREIALPASSIQHIAYCSVVPALDYSVRSTFIKYFTCEPFVLCAGVKTGLAIQYQNPIEVGPDRIANAIAAAHQFPEKNLIIVDLGTATNFDVVSEKGIFLGGAIMPGLQMQMRALNEFTANLPLVRIVKSESALGQSTNTNIQAGLYFGQRGAIKEIIHQISIERFKNNPPIIIGTGGFAYLYDENDNLFNAILPELVLHGIRLAHLRNL